MIVTWPSFNDGQIFLHAAVLRESDSFNKCHIINILPMLGRDVFCCIIDHCQECYWAKAGSLWYPSGDRVPIRQYTIVSHPLLTFTKDWYVWLYIHGITDDTDGRVPRFNSLVIRIVWSTQSNALLKSVATSVDNVFGESALRARVSKTLNQVVSGWRSLSVAKLLRIKLGMDILQNPFNGKFLCNFGQIVC